MHCRGSEESMPTQHLHCLEGMIILFCDANFNTVKLTKELIFELGCLKKLVKDGPPLVVLDEIHRWDEIQTLKWERQYLCTEAQLCVLQFMSRDGEEVDCARPWGWVIFVIQLPRYFGKILHSSIRWKCFSYSQVCWIHHNYWSLWRQVSKISSILGCRLVIWLHEQI